ncbi:hypothetical protein ACQBAR_16675 [Propionibacteriaceae bacterium Y1685]|uniref:hypothetical protein n=1 Tax=Microlunatus sp. Y1700 TaxID=3418487 RepID=UPI003B7FDCB6
MTRTSTLDTLELLIRRRDRCRRATEVLATVLSEEAALAVRVAEAQRVVRVAALELNELEGISPARVWSELRGTREDDRDRHGGVLERARAARDRLCAELEIARAHRQKLERRCAEESAAEESLVAHIDAVRHELSRLEHPLAGSLKDLVERCSEQAAEVARLGRAGGEMYSVVTGLRAWPNIRLGPLPVGEEPVRGELDGLHESTAAMLELLDRAIDLAKRENLPLEAPTPPDASLGLSEMSLLSAWRRQKLDTFARDATSVVTACAVALDQAHDKARKDLDELDQQRLGLARQGAVILETR